MRCRERLEEYWEVDGRMLCERHAGGRLGGSDYYFGEDDNDDNVDDDLNNGNGYAAGRRTGRGNKGNSNSETTPAPPMMKMSDAEARALRRKTQFIDLR